MKHLFHLTEFGLRAYWRNRRARIFGLIMPVGLLILFNSLFTSGDANTTVAGVHVSLAAYYVPSVIVLGLTTNAFAALVGTVVAQREMGVFKRRRSTPAEPLELVGSQILTVLVAAFGTTVILVAISAAFYDIRVPAEGIVPLIAGVALGAAAFCGVGYAVSTFVDTIDTAQPMIQMVMLPLFFISGVWVPSSELPSWLNTVASILPVEHASDVLHRSFAAGAISPGPVFADLGVLALWAVGGALVASRRFSWLPSTAAG
jgi:ABC-2 type transport system permease protein